MLVEALGSALLGLALSFAALKRLPRRLPSAPTVLITGTLGGLFGGSLTHYAFGPGHATAGTSLAGGLLVAAVVVSLLLRPGGRPRPRVSAPSRG
ncbi:hypothetical protein [Streptomyces sp. NPDC097619]|uniref:hypothetical protein n=1 Tax=Streptomyces sp. NPDC097619 TaxID=3157228 RepID=UPI003329757A